MKKIILSEDEKKLILEKYYPKELVNEQKFLSKLFGSSVDDIFRGFGDDAIRNLDDVFRLLYREGSGNLVDNVVMSASGAQIPLSTIKSAIDLMARGKIQPAEVINRLPRHLKDGTEFRKVIETFLQSKGSKQVAQAASKLPVGRLGQDFKNFAQQMSGWIQVKNVSGNMSGWKFHVFADNLDEVAFLYERLLPVVYKYGAGFKTAGADMLDNLSKNAVQRGKGVTIYLPSEVVAKNQQKSFLSDIQNAIKGYEKSGQISGDRMITNNIGYRYELSKPIDAAKGVDMNQYQGLYKANEGGGHNIQGNPDLFQ